MAEFNLLDPTTWPSVNEPKTGPKFTNAVINGVEDPGLPMPGTVAPGAQAPAQLSADAQLKLDLAQIDTALRNPDALAALSLSEQRGNGLTAGNKLLDDYEALTPVQFQQKYGLDTYRTLVAKGIRSRKFLSTTTPERDLLTHAADAAVSAADGANQALIGLANAGIHVGLSDGPIKDAALDWTANLSEDATNRASRLSSDALNQRTYVDSIRTALDQMDNQALSESDKSNDKNFIDNLASHGREFLRDSGYGAKRLIEDPEMLLNMSEQGVGSLVTGGLVAKTAGAVANAGKVLTPSARQLMDEASSKTAFAPTIGGMEGGGASIQAQQAVMNMPEAELMESPKYRELLQNGFSAHEARLQLAADAGIVAMVPAAAVGVLTGKLVEGIELAPLARTNVGGLLANAGKESLEEGVQSAAGQVASNLGVQVSGANPDQNLGEGAGGSFVQGAAAGAGTTALMQGPGVALDAAGKTAVAAAKASVPLAIGTAQLAGQGLVATTKLAGVALRPLIKVGEQRQEAVAAESTVSPEKMAPAIQDAVVSAPVVADGLRAMAAEVGATGADVESYISDVQKAAQLQEADLAYMPDVVGTQIADAREQLGRVPNKFEALNIAGGVVINPDSSEQDRVAAATFILKSIQENRNLFQEELPKFLQKVPQDRPEFQEFNAYANLLSAIEQTPKVRDAIKWAQEKMQQPDATGPLDPKIVAQTVQLAAVAPQAVNANIADQILNQSGSTTETLTPEQRRILQGARNLKKAGETYAEQLGEADKLDFIDKQIRLDGGSKRHQLSLAQHAQQIAAAQTSGNPERIKASVQKLNRFALSHRNKVAALNRSIKTGDQDVKYRAADAEGKSYMTPKGVGVRVGNAGQERFARTVHAEATAIAEMANNFAQLYPELGLPQVQVPELLLDRALEVNQPQSSQVTEKEGRSDTASKKQEPTTSQATTTRTDGASEQQERPSQDPAPQTTADAGKPAGDNQSTIMGEIEKLNERLYQSDANDLDTRDALKREIEGLKDQLEALSETVSEVSEAVKPVSVEPTRVEPVPEPTLEQAELLLDQESDIGQVPAIETEYPLLVQIQGKNIFHRAFKLPRRQKSRLMRLRTPLEELIEALSSSQGLIDFLGGLERSNALRYDIGSEDRTNLQQLLDIGQLVRAEMRKRLVTVLTGKQKANKDGVAQPSYLERLKNNDPIMLGARFRALGILEKTETSYRYNQQLVEAAIVAGLDWAMNANTRSTPPTREQVAEMLEIQDADEVSETLRKKFEDGISLDTAVRSMAESIMRFWGVDPNKDTDDAYVKGIPEAIAKEVLHSLESVGLVRLDTWTFPEFTKKNFGRVFFDKRPENVDTLVRSLHGVHDALADMAMIEKEVQGYQIGAPIQEVDQTQLHNPMVKLTSQQTQALRATQATPHYPNMPMFDFFMSLGREQFVTLFSGHPYTDGDLKKDHTEVGLNKGHWASVQGLQRSLVMSFDNIGKQMKAVRQHAKGSFNPLDPNSRPIGVEQVPTFYRHHINKLGRPQMDGASNPQSDKAAREVYMPTRSVLNLVQQDGSDFAKFLLTIGQAIGMKTEKANRPGVVKGGRQVIGEAVIQETMTAGGKYRPMVETLKIWLSSRNQKSDTPLPVEAVEELARLQSDKKTKLTFAGIHGLINVARYELARENNQDLSKFESFGYLEADGKTNGMINALMLYGIGEIVPSWLRAIAKGGAFFGREGKTLNDHMVEDPKDLYQEGAEKTDGNVATLGRSIALSNAPAHDLFQAFRRVLAALSVDVSLDPSSGDITISRGLTKNPMTITIYGSGSNGIAGNVADDLIGVLYETLSASMESGTPAGELLYGPGGSQALMADLQSLTSYVARKNDNGEWYTMGNSIPIEGSAADFELTQLQKKNLIGNLNTFLVQPMVSAIEETLMKHVSAVADAAQQATQVQSIILKGMFIDKVTQRLAMKQADPEKYGYRKGDYLSKQEQEDILNNLSAFSPIIETGTQGYFLAGGEKSDLFEKTTITVGTETYTVSFPENFSRSLTDDLSTSAFAYGPTLSGVKAKPTLVIGSGDGQMMLNFLSENVNGSANRVEHIFDGLHMPTDAIDEYSQQINQSVFKTWTENANPVRAAYESFAKFMARNPIKALFGSDNLTPQQENARLELARVYHDRFKVSENEIPSLEDMQIFAESLLAGMKDLADSTDARRLTYAEFMLSVDQMASGENPYVNPGSIQLAPNADPEVVADAMTSRYRVHLAKIRGQVLSPPVTAAVQVVGTVEETGATVMSVDNLPSMLKNLEAKLSPTQKEMMRHVGKLLKGSGYRLVFGSTRQLDAWEQANNADRFVPGSNSQNGKIDPVAKVILISNMESETVIHELVHAATIDKVRAFYSNPSSLSKEERAAIERIEGLMGEWLTQDPNKENSSGYEARRLAEAEISRRLSKGQKAEAVNEFMAWVLGNQDLAALAQKTKVKNTAWRIVGDALAALKTLIWGAPNKGPRVGDSLLSNLRFNTRVLINGPTQLESLQQDANAVAMYQSKAFGSNDRLSTIRQRLNSRITSWLEGDGSALSKVTRPTRTVADMKNRALTGQITSQFAFHFPDLKSMQAASTFASIQRALMTEIELNPNALSRMEDLYAHVVGQLKYTDFMDDADQVPPDPNDEKQARDKLDLVLGKFGTTIDAFGRSSLMSSFLALSMTSEEFRGILSKFDKPKWDKSSSSGLDGLVENVAMASVDRLSILLSGEKGRGANVQEALDRLMLSMIENVGDQRTYIERFGESQLDKVEAYLSNQLQETSAAVAEKSAEVVRNTKNRAVKVGATFVGAVATAINEQKSTEAALGLISQLNKIDGWNPIKELIADLVGRTRENAPIFDMISKVRATVQQVRQQFRDELPLKLNSAFTKAVSAEQWSAMYRALGKTDLAAISRVYGLDGALKMLTDSTSRTAEIRKLESSFDKRILDKARQLAHFMVSGEHGSELLRNAYAIAALSVPGIRNMNPTQEMVDEVDRLVTLYAINETDAGSLAAVAELIDNGEKPGVEFVTSYLMGQRTDEMAKTQMTSWARVNHYKGHLPAEAQNEGSLVIVSDGEHAQMVSRGYTRVGAYSGSSADRSVGKRSYYFAPVSGRAVFNQGVLQTVHQTASGVDPETGFTVGEPMAGRIEDPQMVRLIQRMLVNQSNTDENLLPVYDGNGRVVAFERAADPRMLSKLDRSSDLAAMIGVWRGRQAEELLAQEVNHQLIDKLHGIWVEGKAAGREREFVNIAKLDPKTDDKVLIEAVSLIPDQAQAYIEQVFGPGVMMVRRDMLLDTFGARQASVGDLFTGQTRWNPKIANDMEKLATAVFNRDAFKTLVGSERNIQEVVAGVKQMIVVRSVIVPAANMLSNMFQLMSRGVPVRAILHGVGAKTTEISSYVKRRQREIDLEADLRAAEGRNDSGASLKISNQIQAIQDSYRRMSIWPLIEAGEFSAISSGQVTAEDLAISDGKWSTFIERKISALSEPLRTAARYGLVTRDTALFQGLARAVQYGDFVAKAVLYDDLTSRKKSSKEGAIATVNEAFVNYNRLAGRSRQYLESIGLLWFYNYKLRIMKEAAYLLRHNPLRALLAVSVPSLPMIGDIGTPVSDNIVGILNDGKLGYSIGPGMGIGSWQLNPWINLAR